MLATLLLRAGQVVSVPALATAIWDDDPPSSARNTIQGQVKRLRQALGPESGRIVTRSPGYLIEVQPGELDLWAFTDLREQALEAEAAGAWDQAARLLREALALWGGDPLSDVPSAYLRRTEVPRLAELRYEALLSRIDADLCLGRHSVVTGELRRLAAEHPFRERFWQQLMLALYRDGRRGEALAAYQQARRTLSSELGIDPGPRLQELHNQILTGEPALTVTTGVTTRLSAVPAGEPGDRQPLGRAADPGAAASSGPGAAPGVPRQLPSAVAHFTGRAGELAALDEMLDDAGRTARGTVVIGAVTGTAGVGKTALAVRWAHHAAERFRDGQLYVNLRGFDPSGVPVTPGEAIRRFLDALGVPAERVPQDLDSKAALYRSLLAGKRVLIVLDNARDEQQVRPLLPAAAGCLVIITSRSQLAGLAAGEGARLLALDVLSHDEARQVLAVRLGGRAAAEPGAVDAIARLCGRLPLALTVAAARAAARPRLPLADLAAMLRDARGRLDALDIGDPAMNVRAVLSWSVGRLSPAAARMFALLGLHPGPDVTAAAAASLTGTQPSAADRVLEELAGCLLSEHLPGRYASHDLLRAYATECAETLDVGARRTAVGRMLDHYLHTARAAAMLLSPTREQVGPALPAPGVTPEVLASHQQALDWFTVEHEVLSASVALAAGTGFDTCAWQLAWAMDDYLRKIGRWHELDVIERTGLAAATRLGDLAGQAAIRRRLGDTQALLGDYPQASAHLSECLQLYGRLGDRAGQANVHLDLCHVFENQGRLADGLGHAEQALSHARAAGYKAGQGAALSNIGWFHALLGDYERARGICWEALTLFQELGSHHREAAVWDNLGYAEHHLGNLTQAAAYYQRSLALFRETGNRLHQAVILDHLGDNSRAAGDLGEARNAWQLALDIFDDLHRPDAELVRAKLGTAMTRSATGSGTSQPGPPAPPAGASSSSAEPGGRGPGRS